MKSQKKQSDRPLTAQQRLFAEVYASGKSQIEAYRNAYPKARTSNESARAHASRLLTKSNVLEYVKELQESARSSTIATLKETKEFLTAIMRTPIGEISPSSPLCQSHETSEVKDKVTMPSKIAAAQELAKLEGWHAADKLEVTGKDGEPLIPARQMHDDEAGAQSIIDRVAIALKKLQS